MLRVTGLYVGNSPGTGEFPAQRASYAENASIWWRHHETGFERMVSKHKVLQRAGNHKSLCLKIDHKCYIVTNAALS